MRGDCAGDAMAVAVSGLGLTLAADEEAAVANARRVLSRSLVFCEAVEGPELPPGAEVGVVGTAGRRSPAWPDGAPGTCEDADA